MKTPKEIRHMVNDEWSHIINTILNDFETDDEWDYFLVQMNLKITTTLTNHFCDNILLERERE